MGAFLSAFENTELKTHHYIREFGIRNAKINRVNEQKNRLPYLFVRNPYPELALIR